MERLPASERETLGEIEAATSLERRNLLFAAGQRSLGCWDLQRGDRVLLRTDLPCTFRVQNANQNETLLALSDYNRNWSGDPHVWVVDLETFMTVPLSGHERPPHTLMFANEGKLLVSASHDSSCRLWDAQRISFDTGFSIRDGLPDERGRESQDAVADNSREFLREDVTQEHAFLGTTGVAVAIVGSELALFTRESEDPIAVLRNAGDDDLTCVISHSIDPEVVFAGGYDSIIRAWHVKSGNLIAEYVGQSGTIRFLGISSDGSVLVSTSEDESLAAWSVEGKDVIWRTDIHSENLAAFSFVPSEPWLAFAGRSKGNELWVVDPTDGRPLSFVPYRNTIRRVLCRNGNIFIKDRSGNIAVFELRQTR
jgi:WD40 repeat protein